MGGDGSGRPPSIQTIMKRSTPEITPVGDSMFLPNYSGVKPEAIKTSSTIISNVAETDPVFMSLSGAFIKTETDPVFMSLSGSYLNTSTSGAWNTHIANNTQAHTDYMLNTGDTSSGNYFFGTTLAISGANVGIGTTGPVSKLDVNGVVRFTSAATVNPASGTGLEVYYSASGETSAPAAFIRPYDRTNSLYKPLILDAASTTIKVSGVNAVTVTTGGNVGIGTITPGNQLTILKTVDNSAVTINNYVDGLNIANYQGTAGAYGAIKFTNWDGANDGTFIRSLANANNDIDLQFGTYNNNPVADVRMVIKSGGNVGIGTTGPSYKLHVSGAIVGVSVSGATITGTDATITNLILTSGATTADLTVSGAALFRNILIGTETSGALTASDYTQGTVYLKYT